MFGGFGYMHNFRAAGSGPFIQEFRCFSLAMLENKQDKENGDKIILPSSAFERLAGMSVQYPMQFELRNENVEPLRRTHVGVLEFTAPEGQMYIPHWIMQNLLIEQGDVLIVRNVSLQLAKFVKFRPLSVDFLEISNPKAVLENTLRNFSCLTKEDQICINYNSKNYYIEIVELKPETPENAVSIVEADVHVDFDAPVGYVDPSEKAQQMKQDQPKENNGKKLGEGDNSRDNSMAEMAKAREERRRQLEEQKAAYVAFSGTGRRIDDKAVKSSSPESGTPSSTGTSSITQGKWKQRTKGAAFLGEGRSLQ